MLTEDNHQHCFSISPNGPWIFIYVCVHRPVPSSFHYVSLSMALFGSLWRRVYNFKNTFLLLGKKYMNSVLINLQKGYKRHVLFQQVLIQDVVCVCMYMYVLYGKIWSVQAFLWCKRRALINLLTNTAKEILFIQQTRVQNTRLKFAIILSI